MYFEWKTHAFKTPPELRGQSAEPAVIVIGAGPVGLSAALGLAQRGVKVVILEARDQVSDGSRAISLDRLSMRALDRLSAGPEFSRLAIARKENIVFYKDHLVYQMTHATSAEDKHPQFTVLQQCWMEQILLDRLLKESNADLRWKSRVTGVSQTAKQVLVQVETPEGAYTLTAPYAIAADGGRGPCRSLLGLQYESVTSEPISERAFVICDFEMETKLSKARRLFLDPPYKPGATVILHAQPFNSWRLDYSLEEDEDPEQELKPERIKQRLDAHLDMMGETGARNVLWTSVYRPRAVALSRFRKGRFFLAGDAAHQTPIFGGRGLNLGFGDADNLAWKLSLVLSGAADDSLLDSYDLERRQMARKTLNDLAQAAVFMARPSRGVTLMRDAVLGLVPTEPFVRDLFDAHRAPKREGYAQPGDEDEDPPPGLFAGNPLPNPPVARADGQTVHLHDLLAPGFSAIYFCGRNLPPRQIDDFLRRTGETAPIERIVLAAADGAEEAKAAATASLPANSPLAHEGVLLLVRPDGYIAARADAADLRDMEARFYKLLGATSVRLPAGSVSC